MNVHPILFTSTLIWFLQYSAMTEAEEVEPVLLVRQDVTLTLRGCSATPLPELLLPHDSCHQ